MILNIMIMCHHLGMIISRDLRLILIISLSLELRMMLKCRRRQMKRLRIQIDPILEEDPDQIKMCLEALRTISQSMLITNKLKMLKMIGWQMIMFSETKKDGLLKLSILIHLIWEKPTQNWRKNWLIDQSIVISIQIKDLNMMLKLLIIKDSHIQLIDQDIQNSQLIQSKDYLDQNQISTIPTTMINHLSNIHQLNQIQLLILRKEK